jgi:glycine/D-amino acid oxidase-like deaminating enzyme
VTAARPGPLWWAGEAAAPIRPPLSADATVDVCVVGGGLTGLWTAYYLLQGDPSLSVLVLEAEHVGFGASGRNGGWVSALYPVSPDRLAHHSGASAARDQYAALRESVDEVGRVVDAERIGCGFRKGGALVVARNPAQVARARSEVEHSQHWGLGTTWLGPDEARARLRAEGTLGATYNPHCARVHPFRLVQGLAAAVELAGARIHERSRATELGDRRVRVEGGPVVHARHVIRATEAWTARLPGLRRRIAPVYSLVVATEPLPPQLWERIGLADAEVFSEHRNVIVYGQRTVDDRLVFGGRGAPYHFGSRIDARFDGEDAVFAGLRRALRELLPAVAAAAFSHAWGGALGIARDWHPAVAHDPSTGSGHAGGYVGDGVALTNLAGRTLADLVRGQRTPITRLPWVQHRSRSWEPEPLRWLGVNAGLRLADLADREERLSGRPALLGRALSALTGH